MSLNWNAGTADIDLIDKIADRVTKCSFYDELKVKKQHIVMDLTATHCNGCKLDLYAMLHGSLSDFAHDVVGIMRHLDRETGQLQDCFVPRFAWRYSNADQI